MEVGRTVGRVHDMDDAIPRAYFVLFFSFVGIGGIGGLRFGVLCTVRASLEG